MSARNLRGLGASSWITCSMSLRVSPRKGRSPVSARFFAAVSMAVMGKLLGILNRWHMGLTDNLPQKREQTIWLKSMRGDASAKREHGVLATVMAVSVGIALVLFGAWFLIFAEGGGI